MDLSVMKTKVEGGMYGSWNEIMVSPEMHICLLLWIMD
jgi:hypothetical protein